MKLIFSVGWRDAVDGFQQAEMVEPVAPFRCGIVNRSEATPWSSPIDDLCVVKGVDRPGQSIVIAVARTADGWRDPDPGEAFSVLMETCCELRSL